MKNICLVFALLAGACVLGACAQSRPRTDGVSSETHFVKCDANADCEQLGDGYACVDGRCRRSASSSKPSANDGGAKNDAGATCEPAGPGLVFCALESVARSAELCSPQQIDCGSLPLSPSVTEQTAALACVRSALDRKAPFRLLWKIEGHGTQVEDGLVGVSKGNALVVYFLSYDTMGAGGPTASWSSCAWFSLRDGCTGQLNTCWECGGGAVPPPPTPSWCTCTEPQRGHGQVACDEQPDQTQSDAGTIIEPGPCPPNSCELDGVCYPAGNSTEDGCCTCDEQGMGSCIEPGWCPGWVLIGKRCKNDVDCRVQGSMDSGLQCRTDFFGERGICTRHCNYGCPTGTECVAKVPKYDGGTITNMCMRPCAAQADCAMEVRGGPLGSECDAPGDLSKSYCF